MLSLPLPSTHRCLLEGLHPHHLLALCPPTMLPTETRLLGSVRVLLVLARGDYGCATCAVLSLLLTHRRLLEGLRPHVIRREPHAPHTHEAEQDHDQGECGTVHGSNSRLLLLLLRCALGIAFPAVAGW